MHWLDLPDTDTARDDDAPSPSARRRAATRLSLGLGAAVAAGTLGVLAAQGLGLTDMETAASAQTPPTEISEEPAAHPSFGPTATVPPSSPVVPPPPVADVAPAPEPAPTTPPAPPPVPAAHTQAIPTVRQGDPCPTAGARGVTPKGRALVCSGPGDGRTRWRRA